MININNSIYPFIITAISGLSTTLGSIIIYFNISDDKQNKFISFCLSFSLSIMIGISVAELIPNSFTKLINYYNISYTVLLLLILFLLSYILIKILDIIIKKETQYNNLYKLGILNMIILIIHNLPEGIICFISSYNDIKLGIKLSISIMLHNIPEGICTSVPIYYATKNKRKAIKATILSGISEPIGAILSYIFLKKYINDILISQILIVVGCLMITLSIEYIFPRVKEYKEYKFIIYGIVIGFLFIILSNLTL